MTASALAGLESALHLATYVPLHVIKMYVERPRSLRQPVKEFFPAAVLFADISGFTKLAGTLSSRHVHTHVHRAHSCPRRCLVEA